MSCAGSVIGQLKPVWEWKGSLSPCECCSCPGDTHGVIRSLQSSLRAGISPSHGSKPTNTSSDSLSLRALTRAAPRQKCWISYLSRHPQLSPCARTQSSSSCLETWCLFKRPSSAFSFRICCRRWKKNPAQNPLKLQVLCSP